MATTLLILLWRNTVLTINDIIEYYPDVQEYGIIEFESYFTKTQNDIYRLLEIRWWPVRSKSDYRITDIRIYDEMNSAKLTDSQFTRAAVFHCLSYYILPQLTKFDPDGDRFQEQMTYFKGRFEEEFDLILRKGVEYDDDNDGVVETSEKQPVHSGRLVR